MALGTGKVKGTSRKGEQAQRASAKSSSKCHNFASGPFSLAYNSPKEQCSRRPGDAPDS